jgi:hypothetical protein
MCAPHLAQVPSCGSILSCPKVMLVFVSCTLVTMLNKAIDKSPRSIISCLLDFIFRLVLIVTMPFSLASSASLGLLLLRWLNRTGIQLRSMLKSSVSWQGISFNIAICRDNAIVGYNNSIDHSSVVCRLRAWVSRFLLRLLLRSGTSSRRRLSWRGYL